VSICCRTRPQLATLVPERRQEITTEGGLDVAAQLRRVRSTVSRLHDGGVAEVALFVDPEKDQIDAAAESGADAVELHTGDFANADSRIKKLKVLQKLDVAARRASDAGLVVHAGHGLDYENIELFLKTVPTVVEVSIGFAIIARSLFTGMEQAVADMAALVKQPDPAP
jgi:pyridoxine 5-phosphate synthase